MVWGRFVGHISVSAEEQVAQLEAVTCQLGGCDAPVGLAPGCGVGVLDEFLRRRLYGPSKLQTSLLEPP